MFQIKAKTSHAELGERKTVQVTLPIGREYMYHTWLLFAAGNGLEQLYAQRDTVKQTGSKISAV